MPSKRSEYETFQIILIYQTIVNSNRQFSLLLIEFILFYFSCDASSISLLLKQFFKNTPFDHNMNEYKCHKMKLFLYSFFSWFHLIVCFSIRSDLGTIMILNQYFSSHSERTLAFDSIVKNHIFKRSEFIDENLQFVRWIVSLFHSWNFVFFRSLLSEIDFHETNSCVVSEVTWTRQMIHFNPIQSNEIFQMTFNDFYLLVIYVSHSFDCIFHNRNNTYNNKEN